METSRIYEDDKGGFCWVYKLPMFKNFAILRTLLKGMGICLLPVAVFLIYATFKSQGFSSELLSVSGLILGVAAVIGLISLLCYLGVAKLFGGYYVHIFRMDESSITLSRSSTQAGIAEAIGAFSAVAGAVGNNPGLVISGLAQGPNPVVSTKFDDVLSLKIDRDHGEIRVHSFLTWYSVFVGIEDFDFVAEYMSGRCRRARISRI